MNLEEKVKKIISEKLGISLEEISPSSLLRDDLGASPVEIADLFAYLEEELEINLSREDKEGVKTVGQINDLVTSRAGDL